MAYFIGLFLVIASFYSMMSTHQTNEMRSYHSNFVTAPLNQFLTYRRAVRSFQDSHPDFTGSVELKDLNISTNFAPFDPGNLISRESNGTSVTVWFGASPFTVKTLTVPFPENQTVGLSTKTGWMTSGLGNMGRLPLTLPEGYLVSSVTVRGNGS